MKLDLAMAHRLLDQARAAAPGGTAIELTLEETDSSLTRFANNSIHQNVAEASLSLSVRTQVDGRTARAATHRLDAKGIADAVGAALALTRAQTADADLLPMAASARTTSVDRFDPATAAITPGDRAQAVSAMVEIARTLELTAAGICSSQSSRYALLNSAGVEEQYAATHAEYSVTMLAADSSGWAKGGSPRWGDLDAAAGARIAAEKAVASARPREIPAGKITVILEPAAVLDLLGFLIWDFGGLAVLDQRSFLNQRVGTKLFGDNVTIVDDVFHPLQSGPPFDGEGVPRQRVTLVENGVIKNLVYARGSVPKMRASELADKVGEVKVTGHGFALPNDMGDAPMNIVFAAPKNSVSVEQMIASTERGVLVTRCWYIREVEPYEKMLTGMTRDGTFLVENGKIKAGIRNFRFNQGLVHLLNNVEQMGAPVRSSGEEAFDMVVPAMKVRDFNFTEVTRF